MFAEVEAREDNRGLERDTRPFFEWCVQAQVEAAVCLVGDMDSLYKQKRGAFLEFQPLLLKALVFYEVLNRHDVPRTLDEVAMLTGENPLDLYLALKVVFPSSKAMKSASLVGRFGKLHGLTNQDVLNVKQEIALHREIFSACYEGQEGYDDPAEEAFFFIKAYVARNYDHVLDNQIIPNAGDD